MSLSVERNSGNYGNDKKREREKGGNREERSQVMNFAHGNQRITNNELSLFAVEGKKKIFLHKKRLFQSFKRHKN